MKKLTRTDHDGRPRFRDARPLQWRVTGAEADAIIQSLKSYRETLNSDRKHLFDLFRVLDVGFKVVGTGSVGLRDYVVLLEGNGKKDPLFLQVKQEMKSAYSPYLGVAQYGNQGRRVADGQRAIQPASDLLLGWTHFKGHGYLVRQLHDRKGKVSLKTLNGDGLESLAVVAGELMARGHARSGDAVAIAGYCGSGDKVVKAIRDFAAAYADQTEADYGVFMAGVKAGKIAARDS
jgi:uncharacterized protein (DUF2252 family)